MAAVAVIAALAPVVSVSAARSTETASGGDPAEGAALDIVQVAVEQREHTLTLSAAFARPAAESFTTAGDRSSVCFVLDRGSTDRTLCANYAAGELSATRDGRTIAATVKTSADKLVIRATDAKFDLSPGVYDLKAVATAGACDTTTSPVPCVDTVPDTGGYDVRVWRVTVTGCKAKGPLEVRRGPRVKQVALTYDDGPSSYTASLLNKLRAQKVVATFFVLGSQTGGRQSQLRRMYAAGHELANHGWSHYPMGGGGARATGELRRTQRTIRSATGFTPCVFRPPYGDTGPNLRRRARDLGLTAIIWSVDPRDWTTPGSGAIINNVLANTGPGAIILMHDGGGNRSQTLAATGPIINSLRRRGYKFVTVSELLRYEQVTTLTR